MSERLPRTRLGSILARHEGNGMGGPCAELVAELEHWTADELDLLGVLANRLNHGRELYGGLDLATDARQWATEEGEELVDGLLVYAGIRWLLKNLDAMLPPGRARLSVIPRGEDIPFDGSE